MQFLEELQRSVLRNQGIGHRVDVIVIRGGRVLYQEVRPQTFEEYLGNDAIVDSLKKLLDSASLPHAYLFVGDSGCGKTTIARIFANELGCKGIDFIEINASNTRGIDTVREVVEKVSVSPLMGKVKVYLFDESHQLTDAAQQALLKVIEDTPEHVYFMFCTTDESGLINTLKNRCAKYEVKRLRPPEMKMLVETVAEVIGYSPSEDVVRAIVKSADGCSREALVTLEKIAGLPDEKALDVISSTQTSEKDVMDLCRVIVATKKTRWLDAMGIMKSLKTSDSEGIRRQVLGYLRECILGAKDIESAARYSEMISIFEKNTYYAGTAGTANQVFQACLI